VRTTYGCREPLVAPRGCVANCILRSPQSTAQRCSHHHRWKKKRSKVRGCLWIGVDRVRGRRPLCGKLTKPRNMPRTPLPSHNALISTAHTTRTHHTTRTIHARTIHARTIHARTIHAHTIHAHTIHAHTIHAHTIHAHHFTRTPHALVFSL
jgi:hypothetical protein